jgi:hypothetical protein
MVGCGGLRHRGTPREQNGGLFRPFRCALQYGPKAGGGYGPKRLKNMKSFPESRAGHGPAAAAAQLRADAAGAGRGWTARTARLQIGRLRRAILPRING